MKIVAKRQNKLPTIILPLEFLQHFTDLKHTTKLWVLNIYIYSQFLVLSFPILMKNDVNIFCAYKFWKTWKCSKTYENVSILQAKNTGLWKIATVWKLKCFLRYWKCKGFRRLFALFCCFMSSLRSKSVSDYSIESICIQTFLHYDIVFQHSMYIRKP